MSKKVYTHFLFALFAIMMLTTTLPAFAEVIDLKPDSESYFSGNSIKFQGKVEQGDSGLVTIVIRDPNDDFIMLTQSIPDHNYNFEKSVKIDEKFTVPGLYNATGFIVNMTAGITTQFEIIDEDVSVTQPEPIDEPTEIISNDSEQISNTPKLETSVKSKENNISKKPDFVDPQKDPQYYIDRYYGESAYRSWFDRNYPTYTIEEAVGYQEPKETAAQQTIEENIIPEAQATSLVEPNNHAENNSDTAQVVLAIGGLGILFGAVYGIKKKVDDNSKQISLNKDTIRKKIINPLFGSNPSDILQIRLAKGEITLEEYEALEKKLNKKN